MLFNKKSLTKQHWIKYGKMVHNPNSIKLSNTKKGKVTCFTSPFHLFDY
jgi:hypothetical protein